MPTNPNRIDPTAAPATTPDPPSSPTGNPLIPIGWAPWLTILTVVTGAVMPFIPAGIPLTVVSILFAVFTALTGASAGIRKKPTTFAGPNTGDDP